MTMPRLAMRRGAQDATPLAAGSLIIVLFSQFFPTERIVRRIICSRSVGELLERVRRSNVARLFLCQRESTSAEWSTCVCVCKRVAKSRMHQECRTRYSE